MRKFTIAIMILLTFSNVMAQPYSDFGKIALSVIMPENSIDFDFDIGKMENKITQIVASSGLAANGYNNNFVIYPKFSLNETNVIETGMQNITIVNCELSLFIKQLDNNIIFSSVAKTFKGSGKNEKIAINNAISKISPSDKEFKVFMETGKARIIAFYEQNCSDIISKSQSLAEMNDYDQSLALLLSVPQEVACFLNSQEKSIEIYKLYQNKICLLQLQNAKGKLGSNDYEAALNILSQIEPTTACFNESNKLTSDIALKVDKEDKREWDFKIRRYKDTVDIEKQRIRAIKSIAEAYYRRKPSTVNYMYLTR